MLRYDEIVLLSAWLQEKHTEHIPLFNPFFFSDRDLFSAIRQGKNASELPSTLGRPFKEIADILTTWGGMEAEYFTALKVVADAGLKKLFAENTLSFDKVLEQSQAFNDALKGFSNLPEPNKKYTETLTQHAAKLKDATLVPFGLPSLDQCTRGIHRKELTIIAARPSVGKSAFALQVAKHISEAGEKILFFPLEMSFEQNLTRLAVNSGLLTTEHAKTGEWSDNEHKAVTEYMDALEQAGNLLFFEGINDTDRITALVQKHEPFAIILDQLTQVDMTGKDFNGIYEHHSAITKWAQALAMHEDIAVLLLCQVNRCKDDKSAPTLSDLKGSGSIEEDASNVIMLHRVKDYDGTIPFMNDEQPMHLNLAKQKEGETIEFDFAFIPAKYRFAEKPSILEWGNDEGIIYPQPQEIPLKTQFRMF